MAGMPATVICMSRLLSVRSPGGTHLVPAWRTRPRPGNRIRPQGSYFDGSGTSQLTFGFAPM